MMNKRIRSMIDEIFSEMKMSAENLALRDELMANAQARFEDAVSHGRTEEEALREVTESLEDVQSLLLDMDTMDRQKEDAKEAAQPEQEPVIELKLDADEESEAAPEEKKKDAGKNGEFDLEGTLNRAFTVLGGFGQSIVPQAKKIVKDMDSAAGGVFTDLGRAVNRGMRDAQKAAGEAIDRLSGKAGEITLDFGGKPAAPVKEKTAQELRNEAADLRVQAELKEAVGDQEGARDMRAQAYTLETQADALEQAEAIAEAQKAAEAAAAEEAAAGETTKETIEVTAEAPAEEPKPEEETEEKPEEPVFGADGTLNEDVFSRTISDLAGEAERLAGEAKKMAEDVAAQFTGGTKNVSDGMTFPVAGLRSVDIKLDADDVSIELTDGHEIAVSWDMTCTGDEAGVVPECTMVNHALTIRRKNPDVFKTFFSVFKKSGGTIRVLVPRGYAADYTIATTSGDVLLREVDADVIRVSTTSGDVRLEPDASVRAKELAVNTVSGDVAVSACVDAVAVTTVSGDQFLSCDACSVDVTTVSGDVHVEGASESYEADSVSGDIELLCTVAPTRKIDINTMSATARVALPADIRGFVADVSGVSGSIVNEFGPNRYATCGLPIHMDTVSGQLLITRL